MIKSDTPLLEHDLFLSNQFYSIARLEQKSRMQGSRDVMIDLHKDWAKYAAQHISYSKWESYVTFCDLVYPFPNGSLVGYFERIFDGLQLTDGTTIWR